MKVSLRFAFCLLVLLVAGLGASRVFSGEKPAPAAQKQAAPTAAQQSQIERGRYLVEDVAMCGECHTPRDANGNLDMSRWLQGAAIWIMPVHHSTNWGMRAPALAGLLGYTDTQAETVLEKGVGVNGLPIQPPMHIYHMNHADAQAIIAYLRSLPSDYSQQ